MENPFKIYVIVSDIAGDYSIVKTENKFFSSKLINLGFSLNENGYFRKKNIDQVCRVKNIEDLIALDALFSSGRDWSPEELLEYYKDLGIFNKAYKVITWKDKNNYSIRTIL